MWLFTMILVLIVQGVNKWFSPHSVTLTQRLKGRKNFGVIADPKNHKKGGNHFKTEFDTSPCNN